MACAPDRGRKLNGELQSSWPEYTGGICKRLRCQGLGGCQCPFAQRGQWRGSWEPVKMICVPRGAVELGGVVKLLAELLEHEAGGTEPTEMALFRPPLGDFSQKVVQGSDSSVPRGAVFYGAGLALAFASSLSVDTFQGHQQDCQGQY